MKQVTVSARIKARPGMEEKVRLELLSLVEPSRKDAGCISYDLHQALDDRTLFLFHEQWESREHLEKHLRAPHVQALLEKADFLLAEPIQVTLLEVIS